MDSPAAPQGPGTEGTISGLGGALFGLIGTRVELLGVELREESRYLQRMIVRGVVAAFFLGSALVLAGVLLAVAFWDTHRLAALAGATALYGVIGGVLLNGMRVSLLTRPAPFEATTGEFAADMAALRQKPGAPEP